MNWEAVAGMIAAAGAVNYLMLVSIKQSIAENNERMKEWINGSFMRAKETQARLDAFGSRIERLEER